MERKEVMNLIQEINSASGEEREEIIAGIPLDMRSNILMLAQLHSTENVLFEGAIADAEERKKNRKN